MDNLALGPDIREPSSDIIGRMAEGKEYRSFGDVLRELHDSLPHLADILQRAHDNRTGLLNERAKGIRFEGLNEWIGYLKKLRPTFEDPRTELLKFLIERIHANYEAAIDATL